MHGGTGGSGTSGTSEVRNHWVTGNSGNPINYFSICIYTSIFYDING